MRCVDLIDEQLRPRLRLAQAHGRQRRDVPGAQQDDGQADDDRDARDLLGLDAEHRRVDRAGLERLRLGRRAQFFLHAVELVVQASSG